MSDNLEQTVQESADKGSTQDRSRLKDFILCGYVAFALFAGILGSYLGFVASAKDSDEYRVTAPSNLEVELFCVPDSPNDGLPVNVRFEWKPSEPAANVDHYRVSVYKGPSEDDWYEGIDIYSFQEAVDTWYNLQADLEHRWRVTAYGDEAETPTSSKSSEINTFRTPACD